jgi:hypothetical protein
MQREWMMQVHARVIKIWHKTRAGGSLKNGNGDQRPVTAGTWQATKFAIPQSAEPMVPFRKPLKTLAHKR